MQDLITFNEVGKRELGLDWSSLLADLTGTPVESIQPHYMRVAEKGGRLGAHFPNGWIPEHKGLLNMVMAGESKLPKNAQSAGLSSNSR